jgi:hypothetical protein
MRSFAAVFAAATLVVCIAGVSNAQSYDHLQCYKVKDGQKFTSATVDLKPLAAPPFPLAAGCRLTGRAKQLCIPVDKTVVQTDANQLPVSGIDQTNLFTCYKIKCPTAVVPDVEISDQFGNRTLTKFKVSTLCVPTVEGAPPTTTTMGPCVPSCAGKECGDDGCGGSCGICSGVGESCGVTGLCCGGSGASCSVDSDCCSDQCNAFPFFTCQ